MTLTRNPGRVAGLMYLFITLFGPLRLIVIPNLLFVQGNPHATAANLVAHETLFRYGIAADLVMAAGLLFVTFAFFRLFENVDRSLAVLVVILGGIMPSTLYFVNAVSDLAAIGVVTSGAELMSVFEPAQRDALAVLFLRLHGYQNTAAEVLWGLWLWPLAALVWKSRVVPRFIAVWLWLNGFAYLALSFTGVLAPRYTDRVFTYAQPAMLGEVAIMLWLVIRGGKAPGGALPERTTA